MYGIWANFSTFSMVWALKLESGSGSALGWKVGSGSALIKILNPDPHPNPHKGDRSNPDPHQGDADPLHCSKSQWCMLKGEIQETFKWRPEICSGKIFNNFNLMLSLSMEPLKPGGFGSLEKIVNCTQLGYLNTVHISAINALSTAKNEYSPQVSKSNVNT